ncbi:MAG: hypothetical protein V1856_03310 [Candidatus Liptonbacteria bacterium]
MNNKLVFWAIMVVACLAIVWIGTTTLGTGPKGKYDTFAKCLAEKKTTMYGAYWCSHCQSEKRNFGSSFKYVPYVECTREPEVCRAVGVTNYPTWITADGKKYEGEQGLRRLAEISGCELREDVNQK